MDGPLLFRRMPHLARGLIPEVLHTNKPKRGLDLVRLLKRMVGLSLLDDRVDVTMRAFLIEDREKPLDPVSDRRRDGVSWPKRPRQPRSPLYLDRC